MHSVQPLVGSAWAKLAPVAAPAWSQLQPTARTVVNYARHAARTAWAHAQPHLQPYTTAADRHLTAAFGSFLPWQLALLAVAAALLLAQILVRVSDVRSRIEERGALQCVFDGLKSLPVINGIVKREQEKLVVNTSARSHKAVL